MISEDVIQRACDAYDEVREGDDMAGPIAMRAALATLSKVLDDALDALLASYDAIDGEWGPGEEVPQATVNLARLLGREGDLP